MGDLMGGYMGDLNVVVPGAAHWMKKMPSGDPVAVIYRMRPAGERDVLTDIYLWTRDQAEGTPAFLVAGEKKKETLLRALQDACERVAVQAASLRELREENRRLREMVESRMVDSLLRLRGAVDAELEVLNG